MFERKKKLYTIILHYVLIAYLLNVSVLVVVIV